MCHSVWIDEHQADCWSVGQLREFCPNIVIDEHYEAVAETDCLCCVDVPATAEANGFICATDELDSMWHAFTRKQRIP